MLQDVLKFASRRRVPVIRQAEAAECGLACLAMIASYHGHEVDLNTLRRRYPVSLKGVTLRTVIQIAGNLGLICRPLRLETGHLQQLRLPAILHWDMNHFVVLQAVSRNEIVVNDPACGRRHFSLPAASKHLTGVALELLPTEGSSARASGPNCRCGVLGPNERHQARAPSNPAVVDRAGGAGDCGAVLHAVNNR